MIESFKLPVITPETLTGSICSFNDEYGGLPLKSCTSLITGYQEGSGTPSPSNVRPLHAFSSGTLIATGKNELFTSLDIMKSLNTTGTWENNVYTESDVTFTIVIENSKIMGVIVNGVASDDITFKFNKYVTKKGTSKLLNGTPINGSTDTIRLAYQGFGFVRNANGDLNFYRTSSQSDWNNWVCIGIKGGYQVNNLTFNPMIRDVSETDNTFEPYFNTSVTFTFGQSIYQGEIDWERGVVIGTHALDLYDGSSDENWTDYTNYNGFRLNISDMKSGNYMNGLANWLKTISSHEYGIRFGAENTLIYCEYIIDNISEVTDLTSWKTYLSNNPLQLAYELATPIEIPLGGINLLTQEGQNNIYCDTGNTEVKRLKVN